MLMSLYVCMYTYIQKAYEIDTLFSGHTYFINLHWLMPYIIRPITYVAFLKLVPISVIINNMAIREGPLIGSWLPRLLRPEII